MMVGATMEDTKIIEKDAIEEHNGVYGGKWHIISLEGFDLPEGLEYMKKSWEGSWDDQGIVENNKTHKYIASIKISNVPLMKAIDDICHVLNEFGAYDTDLEFENCSGCIEYPGINFVFYFLRNFSMHGCTFTLEYLSYIVGRGSMEGNNYDLSGNTFIEKNITSWNKLREELNIAKNSEKTFGFFDLRNCNFSVPEKEELRQLGDSLNFFV